jgi:hypothetical protein
VGEKCVCLAIRPWLFNVGHRMFPIFSSHLACRIPPQYFIVCDLHLGTSLSLVVRM